MLLFLGVIALSCGAALGESPAPTEPPTDHASAERDSHIRRAVAVFQNPTFTRDQKIEKLRVWADEGDIVAQAWLGELLIRDDNGVKGSPEQAWPWLEKAAAHGEEMAQWRLIEIEKDGQSPDKTQPLRHLQAAAQSKAAGAQRDLAEVYRRGIAGVQEKDPAQFRYWLTQAAEGGDRLAAARLGDYYSNQIYSDINTPNGTDHAQALKWYQLAAQSDHPMAEFKLAELLFRMPEQPQHLGKGFQWLQKSVNDDKTPSHSMQEKLAKAYLFGWGTPRDAAKAMALLEVSARDRSSYGDDKLARGYLRGDGVPTDFGKARTYALREIKTGSAYLFSYAYVMLPFTPESLSADAQNALTAAANAGDASAAYRLACAHWYANSAAALPWMQKAAKEGHMTARYQWAVTVLSDGKADPKDQAEAVAWLREAADKGVAQADYALGKWHFDNKQNAADKAQALTHLQKAAEAGFADAMGDMASAHEKGVLVPQDFTAARRWYERASATEAGTLASYQLGRYYAYGIGGERDNVKAFGAYLRAFAQKSGSRTNPKLALDLALCYLDGRGTPPDATQAFRWFYQSANYGNIEALYFLSRCYAEGIGTPKNPEKAAVCLSESAVLDNAVSYTTFCYLSNAVDRRFKSNGWAPETFPIE